MNAAESLRMFSAGREAAAGEPPSIDAALLAGCDDPELAARVQVYLAGVKAGLAIAEAPPPAEPCPVVNAEQLGELLGGISAKTVRTLLANGKLPAPLKLDVAGVRWSRSVILRWIDDGCPDKKEWEQRLALDDRRPRGRR